jgi:hypothetical protein
LRRGIERRLRELDEEWDIERVLEANAPSVAFAVTVLVGSQALADVARFGRAGMVSTGTCLAPDGLPHVAGD